MQTIFHTMFGHIHNLCIKFYISVMSDSLIIAINWKFNTVSLCMSHTHNVVLHSTNHLHLQKFSPRSITTKMLLPFIRCCQFCFQKFPWSLCQYYLWQEVEWFLMTWCSYQITVCSKVVRWWQTQSHMIPCLSFLITQGK
jgi:hypothetical protein